MNDDWPGYVPMTLARQPSRATLKARAFPLSPKGVSRDRQDH